MRGLPPPPDEVVRLTATFAVADGECSSSWWLLAPGASVASDADLRNIAADWIFYVNADLLARLGADVRVDVLRVESFGPNALLIEDIPAPNAGALDGSTALNACAIITWHTGERRIGSRARTYLPLSRSHLAANKQQLREVGFAEISALGIRMIADVTNIRAPGGGVCTLGTLHRSSAGAPLGSSVFAPFFGAVASRDVGTLDRRIRARGRPSP
jgi:hypothetical protein